MNGYQKKYVPTSWSRWYTVWPGHGLFLILLFRGDSIGRRLEIYDVIVVVGVAVVLGRAANLVLFVTSGAISDVLVDLQDAVVAAVVVVVGGVDGPGCGAASVAAAAVLAFLGLFGGELHTGQRRRGDGHAEGERRHAGHAGEPRRKLREALRRLFLRVHRLPRFLHGRRDLGQRHTPSRRLRGCRPQQIEVEERVARGKASSKDAALSGSSCGGQSCGSLGIGVSLFLLLLLK